MVDFSRINAASEAFDRHQGQMRSRRIEDEDRNIAAADRRRAQGMEDKRFGNEQSDYTRRIADEDARKAQETAVREGIATGLSRVTSDDPIFQSLQSKGAAAAPEAMSRYSTVQTQELDATRHREDQEDRDATRAFTALATGNLGEYQHWAARSGVSVDPAILQNREAARNLSVGMMTAKDIYADDPAQGQIFARTYMQTGNFEQAFRAAGQPRGGPVTLEHVMMNGQRVLASVDANARTAQPVMMGGRPVQTPSPASATTADPAVVKTAQWIIQNLKDENGNPLSNEVAYAMAQMAKTNPGKLWQSSYDSAYRNSSAYNEQERVEAATRAANGMMQGLGVAVPGAGGFGVPQAAPGAPPQGGGARTYNPRTGALE